MNRSLWRDSFGQHYCPAWPCSVCGVGTLRLRLKSLISEETVASKRLHNEEYWGPDYIEYIFSAWADCSHEQCRQSYSISGDGSVTQIYDETDGAEWIDKFAPLMINPTIDIIPISPKCPVAVSSPLRSAFRLYWSNPEASANCIRIALEQLLTHVGVPSQRVDTDGKSLDLSLHRRIELFAKENKVVGEQLEALKWLGNAGSHGDPVSKDDLLDALDLLSNVLEELLGKRSERLTLLVKQLNERYKPPAQ